MAAAALKAVDAKGHLYNILFVLFCAEAYTQFAGVEPAYFLLEKLLHGNLSWT
jgi:acyl-CoA thioesterase FadM